MAKGGSKKSAGDRIETIKAGETLGDNCPIRALGHMRDTYYFADPIGQVRAFRANEMTPNNLISLFQSEIGWLEKNCKTQSRRGTSGLDKTSWHNPTAVVRLIAACRREGFFDPDTQTRGPGIWPFSGELMVGEEFAGSEQLVVHTGDRIAWVTYEAGAVNFEWQKAGVRLGDFVYPACAAVASPGDEAATSEEIERVVAMINRWRWREGGTVPQLLLGHIVCQILLALMPFRPSAWIQAVTGGGKSTLLNFVELLLQGRALRYENATAAGLREDFKTNEARPVYINEAESTDDNRRLQGLVEMARYVYSAGEGNYRRGGSQGAAHSPTAMFMFAAVEPPPLLPQDANRIVMMRMAPLKEVTSEQMERFDEEMPALARMMAPKLSRRAIEIYPLFAPTLNLFRKGLIAADHTPRTANTLGVLLAAAHLIQHAAIPDESDVEEWTKQLDAKLLATKNDVRSNEGLCLLKLKTFKIAPFRAGETKAIGDYIVDALYSKGPSDELKVIKRYGVAIVTRGDPGTGDKKKWVAVSNKHDGLEEVFKGSRWPNGGWVEALRQLDGAIAAPGAVHFAGSSDRATLIPMRYFPQAPLADTVEDLDAQGEGADHG